MFVTKNKTGSMCMMLDANGPDGEDGDGWEKLKSPPGRSGLFIIQHHSEYRVVLESLLIAYEPRHPRPRWQCPPLSPPLPPYSIYFHWNYCVRVLGMIVVMITLLVVSTHSF